MDFHTINIEDNEYPPLLKEVENAPSVLYVRGSLPEVQTSTIAIVGTRKATKASKELAYETARDLAKAGVTVISGLAMGIDTEAHRGTLDAGGTTVAVLGNGIDSVYPAQNEKLARAILENGGGIISEYGPAEPSFAWRFIERNRIISGLSLGVVVIEAPERSGAISTARFAAEQGRSVFVFPSSPHNRSYAGSHELIRDGATLVTNTAQILEDLGINTKRERRRVTLDLSGDEYRVVAVLSEAGKPLSIDTIIELTTLEPHVASEVITTLVVEGVIKEGSTGYEISNS